MNHNEGQPEEICQRLTRIDRSISTLRLALRKLEQQVAMLVDDLDRLPEEQKQAVARRLDDQEARP